ncbi:MAG: APC family permease [Rhizobacter sp.]|nr:APC family permease [Chlorobiales bacterium]
MQNSQPNPTPVPTEAARSVKVVVVTTVMLSFISFWRAASIVLADLASTAYYIGGITESAIGTAAPYFILAVMMFAYAVRAVYIESCSMFTRGGVYRVVRSSLGPNLAKVSVSALMFDYVLTGPISSVSAGQYLSGLINSFAKQFGWSNELLPPDIISVVIAICITLFFWWENTKGIEESSEKALRIMQITTVMIAVMLVWAGLTLATRGFKWPVFDFNFSEESLGFIHGWEIGKKLLTGETIGLIGILIALGHSMLAMSGEESLAQVYREIEAPKLQNLKRAGFIIWAFSIVFTAGFSFLAVMIIPDSVRVSIFKDNLLSGLALNLIGPEWATYALNAFVVIVGVLILSGAVNTSFIGANGVLNRVAEDGILADWFRKPHPTYGTTFRMINLITAFQLITILLSRGNVILLGEAYAFGVIWSFVFNAFAMLALRFKDTSKRRYKVPLNIHIGKVEFPVGIALIFIVLLAVAIVNLFTKSIATVAGILFTLFFMILFNVSERLNARQKEQAKKNPRGAISLEDLEKLEKFNQESGLKITPESIGSEKKSRVLVAVKDPKNLEHFDKAIDTIDTDKTDIIVMTVRVLEDEQPFNPEMTRQERELFTEIVNIAEDVGKPVIPLLVPSYNAFFSIVNSAKELGVTDVYLGESERFSMETELEQLAMIWGYEQRDADKKIMFRVIADDKAKIEVEL